jgi:hypothetical protein
MLPGDDPPRWTSRAWRCSETDAPTGVAAVFDDDSLRIGRVTLPAARMICAFNWENRSQTLAVRPPSS